jgi:hypothetical protein
MSEDLFFHMTLNKTYSKVLKDKNFCDSVPIENGLRQGEVLSSLLLNIA